jgi:hypothetical protein
MIIYVGKMVTFITYKPCYTRLKSQTRLISMWQVNSIVKLNR